MGDESEPQENNHGLHGSHGWDGENDEPPLEVPPGLGLRQPSGAFFGVAGKAVEDAPHVVPPSGGPSSNNPALADQPTPDRLKPGLHALHASPSLRSLRSLRLNTGSPVERAEGDLQKEMVPLLASLEQLAKGIGTQPSLLGNGSHGDWLDRIIARDDQGDFSIAHDHMFTLADYSEARFLKPTNRDAMVDAWNARHLSHGEFDMADGGAKLCADFGLGLDVFADGTPQILQGLLAGVALGDAPRQIVGPSGKSFRSLNQGDSVFHNIGTLTSGPVRCQAPGCHEEQSEFTAESAEGESEGVGPLGSLRSLRSLAAKKIPSDSGMETETTGIEPQLINHGLHGSHGWDREKDDQRLSLSVPSEPSVVRNLLKSAK